MRVRGSRPAPRWGVAAGRVLVVAGSCAFGLWTQWTSLPYGVVAPIMHVLVGVAFVLTGVLVGAEREQRANGALFIAIGLLGQATGLAWWPNGVLPVVGWVVWPLPLLVLLVILARYPATRITDPLIRRFVAAAFVAVPVPYLVSGVLWDPRPSGQPHTFWWPVLANALHLAGALWDLYTVAGGVVAAGAVAMIVRRYRRCRGLARRELVPVLVSAAAVALDTVVLQTLAFLAGTDRHGLALDFSTNLLMLTVPVAFAAAALRRRLDRSAVADLVLAVPQPATVATVRDALRRVLIDPKLEVYVWLPERQTYTDGTDTAPVVGDGGRLRWDIDDARGDPLAIVLTDPALDRRADLVDAAVRAAALSLENARLHTDLLARLEELEQSRTRIVEAGVAERRRVERDLHDGAQQRLLALAATIGRARAAASDPAVQTLMEQARGELRQALEDLRDLARGIHPAVLEQVGLSAAVETLAESMPMPVQVTVQTERLPPALESTAYFVICEALANIVKHAGAGRAAVTVRQRDSTIHLTVEDDGVGGATAAAGGGIAGLTDRVAALGGRLRMDSPAGTGTRLIVELPCES